MNRKIILLNLALIALAGVCVYQLRVKRRVAAVHEQTVLSRSPQPAAIVPPPAAVPVRAPMPGEYIAVAQQTLFSKDRNPNVVIPAPPPPPPPAPMPQLPLYNGQMALGEPVIFLTLPGNDQKGYHKGDEVGPFTVKSFDRDRITFEWDGKPVERELNELKPKDIAAAATGAVSAGGGAAPDARNAFEKYPQPGQTPAAAQQPSGASSITSLGSTSNVNSQKSGANKEPSMGAEMGGGFRACAPGDTSPAGTTLNGYRKVQGQTLMGSSCHWEQIK